MRAITASETSRPVRSPMELDVGRVTPREVLAVAALTVCLLFVAAFSGLMCWVILPRGPFQDWAGWRFAFLLFGVAVSLFSLGLAATLIQLVYQDWTEYRQRLNDWHEVALAAYQANDGQEVERTMTISDLSPALPLHMLAVALSAHRRVQQGTPSAFSVRSLEGPVFLGGVRMGDLSPSAAETASKQLATLGLIKGRGPRQSGEWVPQSETDVIGLLIDNWKKV